LYETGEPLSKTEFVRTVRCKSSDGDKVVQIFILEKCKDNEHQGAVRKKI
jgi:hypothetical protein